MSIITIILFFIYTWGLGFTATSFLKNSDNYLERNLMRIGIGLGIFPILAVLLNLLHIPLDWKFFLILSLILPIFFVIKKRKKLAIPKLRLTKQDITILIVILLFLATFYMYAKGAFNYPYLEDDDPWAHAMSVKYISIEKTAFEPIPGKDFFAYIDPYPPGYDMLFAILHQTSSSINWTLKFFNALIISLGIIFFYFFAKVFMGDRNKALFSTFVLTVIPCYLSHFIWAHSLIVTLFFPAMYCLEKIKDDKKWICPSILLTASILLIQPTQIFKIGTLFIIYFVVKSISEKRFLWNLFISLAGGLVLSFIWWFNKATELFVVNLEGLASKGISSELGSNIFVKIITAVQKSFPNYSGTATRSYTLNDFFIAKSQNMINNPIGIGVFISVLILFALVFLILNYKTLFDKKNSWITITLLWLLFTFLMVNSMTFNLPIGIFAFRTWMLLAIPVSIISSIGLWFLFGLNKKSKIFKTAVLVVVIIGILLTAGYQKYTLNTATWSPGAGWLSMEEIQAYLWLNTLEPDTKIYPLAFSQSAEHVIGLDQYVCRWCEDEITFGSENINKTTEEINRWLKTRQYQYTIIDAHYTKKYGANKTNEKIQEFVFSNLFVPQFQNNGAIIFKVV